MERNESARTEIKVFVKWVLEGLYGFDNGCGFGLSSDKLTINPIKLNP